MYVQVQYNTLLGRRLSKVFIFCSSAQIIWASEHTTAHLRTRDCSFRPLLAFRWTLFICSRWKKVKEEKRAFLTNCHFHLCDVMKSSRTFFTQPWCELRPCLGVINRPAGWQSAHCFLFRPWLYGLMGIRGLWQTFFMECNFWFGMWSVLLSSRQQPVNEQCVKCPVWEAW